MTPHLHTAGGTVAAIRHKGAYRLPDDVMNDIRMRMHDYAPRELADAAEVSLACIYALRSGRTKWPRGGTLFGILRVLGIELMLVDAYTKKPLRGYR